MRASLCLLGTVAACLMAAEDKSAWNVRDHVPLGKVIVQSHRGAGVLAPENSVEGFETAWKLATIPEADLRTTRDGVIVAFHDNDFKRILPGASDTMRAQSIADLTWKEVQQLDIGSWKGAAFAGQRVPAMKELYAILAAHPERRFYIDIKNVNLAQLAKESAPVQSQFMLASTDYSVIRRWMELAPRSATLRWMGGTEQELAARLQRLREVKFAAISQLQIHVWWTDGNITPSQQFLLHTGEELRAQGVLFQTLPWDSKDPRVFHELMDLGVASFATGYPDVAMQAIREYYQQRK